MRALGIVERAYRGSIETQFADVLYQARALHLQLGQVDVALRGLAVTYAVRTRPDAGPGSGLPPGDLGTLPDARGSLAAMLEQGITVYADSQDVARLELAPEDLISGVRCEDPRQLARRWPDYDEVWFL